MQNVITQYPESFHTQRYATECRQSGVDVLLVLSLLGKLVKKNQNILSVEWVKLKILSVLVNTNQAEDDTDTDNDDNDNEIIK